MNQGILQDDQNALDLAAYKLTNYEQMTIIVPAWASIRETWGSSATTLFSNLTDNIMSPHGDTFHQAVPSGNLSNTDERWKWIDDGTQGGDGSPNGIIGAWKNRGVVHQTTLVRRDLRIDSQRFSQLNNLPAINDHLDQP